MSERAKRILLILGFIGIVFFLAFLLINFLFLGGPVITPVEEEVTEDEIGSLPSALEGSPDVTEDDEDTTDLAPGELPPSQVADGGPTFTTLITTNEVVAANLTGNDISYYDPDDGKFYIIDEDGNVVALSNATFPGAESVSIANDASAAAIEFPDGSNIIYDFENESQTTLPSHWEEFEFTEDADEVVSKSLGVDPNNRALVVTQTDGSRTEVLTALGTNADRVTLNTSPNNNIVGFSETGSVQTGFGRAQIYLIGEDGEEAGAIVVEGGNFSAIWSPSGSHILYSVADSSNDDRPSLWYVKGTGDVGSGRKKFGVETWVEKCTFQDSSTVICAVPREVTDGSGFDHGLVRESDDVYTINVNTGRAVLLAEPVLDLQMFNLFVSEDGSTLYFTDQAGRLNTMQLN